MNEINVETTKGSGKMASTPPQSPNADQGKSANTPGVGTLDIVIKDPKNIPIADFEFQIIIDGKTVFSGKTDAKGSGKTIEGIRIGSIFEVHVKTDKGTFKKVAIGNTKTEACAACLSSSKTKFTVVTYLNSKPGNAEAHKKKGTEAKKQSDESTNSIKPHTVAIENNTKGQPVALVTNGAKEEKAEPIVTFGSNAKSSDVSSYSLTVLKDIMKKAEVKSVMISSTARDATSQARVMFDNIEANGVEHQKDLYGKEGDKVIDVYVTSKKADKSSDQIKAAMKTKIDEIGVEKLSKHGGDQSKINVFDVAPSSVEANKKAEFIKQVDADSRVSIFLKPPKDPGYHLAIPQVK
ncbi:MAG: hypothetical protein Q7U91_05730 [Sideroxyarcus sp.]|nr:hypothetical protein [Sideroxyarcus sp.]